MTTANQPPFGSSPAVRLVRAGRWVWRGANAVLPAVFVGAFFGFLGFGTMPSDLAHRNAARDLAAHGSWSTVADPEVHVSKNQGRGGDYYETDDVRVHLPGLQGMVGLSEVQTPVEYDTRLARRGWQPPTERTGYLAPLDVRYRVASDGTVLAMARKDLTRVANSRDPQTGLLIGLSMLALVGALVSVGNNPTVRRIVGAATEVSR